MLFNGETMAGFYCLVRPVLKASELTQQAELGLHFALH